MFAPGAATSLLSSFPELTSEWTNQLGRARVSGASHREAPFGLPFGANDRSLVAHVVGGVREGGHTHELVCGYGDSA